MDALQATPIEGLQFAAEYNPTDLIMWIDPYKEQRRAARSSVALRNAVAGIADGLTAEWRRSR